MTEPFGARFLQAIESRGRLCVGIDPHAALLEQWGLPDSAYGLERFALTAVEALAGDLAVLKPQSAFFERHGSAGIAVLERTIEAARDAGALVLLDVKRGDVGSTAAAYADAYLDPASSIAVDAVTVSPFLGFGSLMPFLDRAQAHGRGVFVLAATSNPGGGQVQRATTAGDVTVTESVLTEIAARNVGWIPLGSVGAVVGANLSYVPTLLDCGGPLLAPGFGAQGGTVADVRRIFDGVLHAVLPSTSRGVLAAGPDPMKIRGAALTVLDELTAGLR